MELEFDKEIDAILRKALKSVPAASGAIPHLDADTIAAFVENALPQKAKLLYIQHLADCDICRKQLSHVMRMYVEADAAAASSVSGSVAAAIIPWYQSLFKTPGLALAMGALVVALGGLLGYLALQNVTMKNAEVSQVTEPEKSRGGPFDSGEGEPANVAPSEMKLANMTAANTVANSAIEVAPAADAAPVGRTDLAAGKPDLSSNINSVRSGQFQIDGASGSGNNFMIDGTEAGRARPAPKSAAASPPVTTDSTVSERDEKKPGDDRLREESKDTSLAKEKRDEDRVSRDMPRAASKVGPTRSGPLQNQSNQVFNMAVTRQVGGKSFNNRNGAWYDSAYHGQATKDVRRGTGEYKKLDSGLRNIADSVGGTVVVVWKEKAYRIQ